MRRLTLITVIVLLLALLAVAVYQLSLGLTVEERLDRPSVTPAGPG